jgi:hypothetical protein
MSPQPVAEQITAQRIAKLFRDTYEWHKDQWPKHDAWAVRLADRLIAMRRAPRRLSKIESEARKVIRRLRCLDAAQRPAPEDLQWTEYVDGRPIERTLDVPPSYFELAFKLLERVYPERPRGEPPYYAKARDLAAGLAEAHMLAGRPAPSFTNKEGPAIAVLHALLDMIGEEHPPSNLVRALRGFTWKPPQMPG